MLQDSGWWLRKSSCTQWTRRVTQPQQHSFLVEVTMQHLLSHATKAGHSCD